jgi:hypothetical protein
MSSEISHLDPASALQDQFQFYENKVTYLLGQSKKILTQVDFLVCLQNELTGSAHHTAEKIDTMMGNLRTNGIELFPENGDMTVEARWEALKAHVPRKIQEYQILVEKITIDLLSPAMKELQTIIEKIEEIVQPSLGIEQYLDNNNEN